MAVVASDAVDGSPTQVHAFCDDHPLSETLVHFCAENEGSVSEKKGAQVVRAVIAALLQSPETIDALKARYTAFRQSPAFTSATAGLAERSLTALSSQTRSSASADDAAPSEAKTSSARADGRFVNWVHTLSILRELFWGPATHNKYTTTATVMFDFVSGSGSFLMPPMQLQWQSLQNAAAVLHERNSEGDTTLIEAYEQQQRAVANQWHLWARGAIDFGLKVNLGTMFQLRTGFVACSCFYILQLTVHDMARCPTYTLSHSLLLRWYLQGKPRQL